MNYLTKILKRFSVTLSILFIGTLIQSCQPDDGTASGDVRDEYVGAWHCIENSSINGPSSYEVSITKGTQDDIVKVSNLYNLGVSHEVELTVFDNNITIATQSVDGYEFSGNGSSTVDYSKFTLDYKAIGGGDTDNVQSTFTK